MLRVRSEFISGEKVRIHCPVCETEDTLAQTFTEREQLSMLYFLPLCSMSNNFVRCLSCRSKLFTRLPLEELTEYHPEDLEPHLSHQASFVFKFLAAISLLLFFMPIVGLILAIIALTGTWNRAGWPRTVSRISTVLSVLLSILFAVILALGG